MVIVDFTEGFEKELKKNLSKKNAIDAVKKLMKTTPNEGDIIASIGNILLKEKRLNTFRFYFVQLQEGVRFLSKEELKEFLIRFIGLSKKNNQQKIIDKLKKQLQEFGMNL